MLRINNSLRKWSKRNIYDLHLLKMNPFDIHVPFIKIAKSELLFEQYRMDLKCDEYEIEVRNDDAIKRNRILFDFVQRTFNHLYGLYLCEICLLIHTIIKDQFSKHSESKIDKMNRGKEARYRIKEVTYKPSKKILFYE